MSKEKPELAKAVRNDNRPPIQVVEDQQLMLPGFSSEVQLTLPLNR